MDMSGGASSLDSKRPTYDDGSGQKLKVIWAFADDEDGLRFSPVPDGGFSRFFATFFKRLQGFHPIFVAQQPFDVFQRHFFVSRRRRWGLGRGHDIRCSGCSGRKERSNGGCGSGDSGPSHSGASNSD